MRILSPEEVGETAGGIGMFKLFGSVVVGAIGGALKGIPAGPAGIVGNAIFGAGMGAAGCAISDASNLADEKKKKEDE